MQYNRRTQSLQGGRNNAYSIQQLESLLDAVDDGISKEAQREAGKKKSQLIAERLKKYDEYDAMSLDEVEKIASETKDEFQKEIVNQYLLDVQEADTREKATKVKRLRRVPKRLEEGPIKILMRKELRRIQPLEFTKYTGSSQGCDHGYWSVSQMINKRGER